MRREHCSFVCNMFLEQTAWGLFELVVCLDNSCLELGAWGRRGGRLLLCVLVSLSVVGSGIRKLPSCLSLIIAQCILLN